MQQQKPVGRHNECKQMYVRRNHYLDGAEASHRWTRSFEQEAAPNKVVAFNWVLTGVLVSPEWRHQMFPHRNSSQWTS
jgi:hypothetical protein